MRRAERLPGLRTSARTWPPQLVIWRKLKGDTGLPATVWDPHNHLGNGKLSTLELSWGGAVLARML